MNLAEGVWWMVGGFDVQLVWCGTWRKGDWKLGAGFNKLSRSANGRIKAMTREAASAFTVSDLTCWR
jgi:hypothetical protein